LVKIQHILVFMKSFKNILEIIAAIITIASLPFIVYQIRQTQRGNDLSNKSFQVGADPQLNIYPQIIYNQNPDYVDLPDGVANLILKNNFFGKLDEIKIFADLVNIIQDRANHDIWTCNWSGSFLPIATSTAINPDEEYKFSFRVAPDLATSYFQKFRNYITWSSVIRLRVNFYKDIGKQTYLKDFYFTLWGPNGGPVNKLERYPSIDGEQSFYTKNGEFVSQQDILNKFKDSNSSNNDPRCSTFSYGKSKGLDN